MLLKSFLLHIKLSPTPIAGKELLQDGLKGLIHLWLVAGAEIMATGRTGVHASLESMTTAGISAKQMEGVRLMGGFRLSG